MEILKAISILSSVATRNNYYYITEDEISEAFDLSESALRKQVPLKPIPCSADSTWSKCPICGDTYIDEYCGKCGQKLDWSES